MGVFGTRRSLLFLSGPLFNFSMSARKNLGRRGVYNERTHSFFNITFNTIFICRHRSKSHVFVSSVKMLEQLQSNGLKISLNSVERDFKDQIEISTITGSITAKCHKAFQIGKQD